MRPIKHDAIQNDLRLMEMALYETSKGQTRNTTHSELLKKISEYKRLIKRESYTIDELEDRVFSRFGITDERSRSDTAIYDATMDIMPDQLNSLFGGLFRRGQGLPTQIEGKAKEAKEEGEGLTHDDMDDASQFMQELDEIDRQVENDNVDKDFPEDYPEDLSDADDDLPF